MEKLYITLIDTPGLFAFMIRRFTGITYNHVALSMDPELDEVYTFGRRWLPVTYFAGFIREHKEKVLRKYPFARYRIVSIDCTAEQKEQIHEELMACFDRRFHYHYSVIGLPFLVANRPFYLKNQFTCSSFLAKLLDDHELPLFDKHFSLVTPRDFYELQGTQPVYEGPLSYYLCRSQGDWEEGNIYGT